MIFIKKNIFIFFTICLIGVCLVALFSSQNNKILLLNGTFKNEKNSFNSLVFDEENKTYTYYNYISTDTSRGELIKENGFFDYSKVNEYKITSGIFKEYIVEVHKEYIILENNSVSEKYIKTSTEPIYTVE